jgi:hypothetical protein
MTVYVAEAQGAVRVGTAFSPPFLLTAVLSLATAWSAAGPFGLAIDPKAVGRSAALRRNIKDAVRLLVGNGKVPRPHGKNKPQ